MAQKQNDAKLLFEYKPNPNQQDIKDLVNWLYDSVQNIHKELLNNFHELIETEEEYLSISKSNLFIF